MGIPQPSLQDSRLRHNQTAAQREEEPEKHPRPDDWLYWQQSATSLAGLIHIMAIRSSLVRRYFVQHASYTKTPGQSCLARRLDRETGKRFWLGRTPDRCMLFPLGSARAKDKKKGEERKGKRNPKRWPPWLFPECPLPYLCRPDGALGSVPRLHTLAHHQNLTP